MDYVLPFLVLHPLEKLVTYISHAHKSQKQSHLIIISSYLLIAKPFVTICHVALTVQYLTGRFIGDYYSGSDLVYRHEIPHLGGSFTTRVDIVDTSQSLDSNGSAHSIFLRLFFFK